MLGGGFGGMLRRCSRLGGKSGYPANLKKTYVTSADMSNPPDDSGDTIWARWRTTDVAEREMVTVRFGARNRQVCKDVKFAKEIMPPPLF
jgi:hypothetical protein